MKKPIALLFALVLLAFTAPAQDSLKSRLLTFEQGVEASSNLTFAVYPSYAPDLVNDDGKSDHWGAGLAALYSFNGELGQHLFTGVRLDWLGSRFWAPSIQGGLKADVQILGHNFVPFAYTGTVVPISGAGDSNGDFGLLIGGGVKTSVWHGKLFGLDSSLALGAAVEKWARFDGQVYHIAPVLTIKW